MSAYHSKIWMLLLLPLLIAWIDGSSGGRQEKNNVAPFWQQETNVCDVVCLVYHRFGDSRYPSTNTSEAAFEKHLKYLSDNGFKSYTVSGLINEPAVINNDEKKVLITVDDGFSSFMDKGLPLLEKYNMKATVYVNTESVGWSDYLTWEQLKEINAKGIEIGSHSHQHKYFLNVPEDGRADVFEKDLLKAESFFEEHLGFVPKTYAYPYGEFSEAMVDILRKHNYQIAFAQKSGVMSNRSHPWAVSRFPVAGSHVGMEQFRSKVHMRALHVRDKDHLPIIVKEGERLHYSVKLTNDDFREPFNCFVAGQSSPDVITHRGDSLAFSLKVPSNRRRTLVTVTAQGENGSWYWFSRLLVNPGIEE